uniref:Uncharacterized protein n=1 Tax=Zea mays TaxID=4577 RepID=A0A804P5B2_MAIZE
MDSWLPALPRQRRYVPVGTAVTTTDRRRRRRRRRRPGSEPDPAHLGGAGRVPPVREGPERLHPGDALSGAHPRHGPPGPGGVAAGGGVEQRLPPRLPGARRVAQLQGAAGPAPRGLEPRDAALGARAGAGGAARPALGAAERAGAAQRRHGHAVPGRRRERVGAVAEDAEREAPLAGRHARQLQLRRERRLRVQPRVAGGGQPRERRQPGQRRLRGAPPAVAQPVVEPAEARALRDDVGGPGQELVVVVEAERRRPEAVQAGAQHGGVGEVASRLAVADHVQAPFHQTEVLQQALLWHGVMERWCWLQPSTQQDMHGKRNSVATCFSMSFSSTNTKVVVVTRRWTLQKAATQLIACVLVHIYTVASSIGLAS